MSFSSDQFISKLNALEDTQESISAASKWLLSQYKEAPQVAECWKRYLLRNSVNTRRKLLAIYLANHVVQQAKSKKIRQFQDAFGEVAADTIGQLYASFPTDLKKKVKRVVDIWGERNIFSKDVTIKIQHDLKSASSTIENAVIPSKLKELAKLQTDIDRGHQNSHALKLRFDEAINALDPSSVVYDENFQTVSKIGQTAKDTVSNTIKLRQKVIQVLNARIQDETMLLEYEENILNEIDLSLTSKNPANLGNSTSPVDDDGVLPTYDDDNGDDDDASDSDSSSDTEESSNRTKRGMDSVSQNLQESDSSNKKKKTDSIEEYEPGTETLEETPETGASITSNIQDLLSKLAN